MEKYILVFESLNTNKSFDEYTYTGKTAVKRLKKCIRDIKKQLDPYKCKCRLTERNTVLEIYDIVTNRLEQRYYIRRDTTDEDLNYGR